MATLIETPLDLSKPTHESDTNTTPNPASPRHTKRASSVSSGNTTDDSDSGYGNHVDHKPHMPCFPGQSMRSTISQQYIQDGSTNEDVDNKDFRRGSVLQSTSPQPTVTPSALSPRQFISNDTNSNGTRPFKMYPMDAYSMYNYHSSIHPNTIASPMGAASLLSPTQNVDSGFSPLTLTPLTSHLLQRRRRAEKSVNPDNAGKKATVPVSDEQKDPSYWERRRKNNDAAKRSRDARRCKEEEIAMRAAFLEQENLKLKAQVAILKNETAKLHYMLYSRV